MASFVTARVEEVSRNGCACAGWAWGEFHLRTGAIKGPDGKLHHPTCRCPGGVVGCREGHLFRCPKHGGRR